MSHRVSRPVRDYEQRVARLQAALAELPDDARIRLRKRTSNLFRTRDDAAAGLVVDEFAGVICIDRAKRTANVLGMTTYEELVDATLAHGFMPKVVPQLRTITLGGAVTGLGIESSSFRNGLPHESVRDMDILVACGDVVTARPDNEHRDLFYGFPNSYGSLGYALRLTIDLDPVTPFVELTHERHSHTGDFAARLTDVAATGERDGQLVDFVDAVYFSSDEQYVVTGRFVESAPYVSDYSRSEIYYRSIQERTTDYLTTHDYLWRWDTDWFWCSAALGVQRPSVRRLIPKRYLRSDTYWRIVNAARRRGVIDGLDDLRGRARSEPIVQDVEIPADRTAEFLDYFTAEIGISPVWLCPLKQSDSDVRWELYQLDPAAIYHNVGFWSSKQLPAGAQDGFWNRRIEAKVSELGGRKSLYSTAYYDEDEFWTIYNGPVYEVLKKAYDPDGRFPSLYDKTVGRR